MAQEVVPALVVDANREAARAVRAAFIRVAQDLVPDLDAAHDNGLSGLRALAAQGLVEWTPKSELMWQALLQSVRNGRRILDSIASLKSSLSSRCRTRPAKEFAMVFTGASTELNSRLSPLDLYMLLGRLIRAYNDDLVAKEVMLADLQASCGGEDTFSAFAAFWEARIYIPPDLSKRQLQALVI